MDTSIYRTWDEGLRAARHAVLLDAARAADAAAKAEGVELFVTGSLSRGQTHPWSDLDLVVRQVPASAVRDPWNAVWAVSDATRLYDGVDVMREEDVIEPLRPGILGSAIPFAEVPPLGGLPDPELALPRCAVSMETVLPHFRAMLAAEPPESAKRDPEIAEMLVSSGLAMQRDMMEHRVRVCLKRLAVFQDGGRSRWLDGDDAELPSLLERLSAPAREPFDRPAVLTPEAAAHVGRLLTEERAPRPKGDEVEAMRRTLADCADAFEAWAAWLRSVSGTAETHGLPSSPAPAP